MPMTNMIRTVDEMKADGMCSPCCSDGAEGPKPEYPWGLRLSLGKPEMDKLGVDLAAVGTEMTVVAKVKVVEARQNADEQGERKSMELQIADMDLQLAARDPRSMFPNSDMA
ncbi:capsid staple protein [Propionivibrio dicarboxylicus]|uniref:Uncharacterized protein n=1 Tax=Propionivibrio dicarboxylicus TaxID=83767 RepID=A0A1G8AQB7_9RHOO|nr:hypothetical protein [Propionivibrio dicarboxylicus]SDH23165.1 hypothetical protein SAMN05660652_01463 [Propionivibrio dicarboxylicus]